MEARVAKTTTLHAVRGGKAPLTVVTDFIVSIGGEPDPLLESTICQKYWQCTVQGCRFFMELNGVGTPSDIVFTMHTPICTVPLRRASDILVNTLEKSMMLIGCKAVLIENDLHLGTTLSGQVLTCENLRYHFNLIVNQKKLFFAAINES